MRTDFHRRMPFDPSTIEDLGCHLIDLWFTRVINAGLFDCLTVKTFLKFSPQHLSPLINEQCQMSKWIQPDPLSISRNRKNSFELKGEFDFFLFFLE